VQAEHGQSTLEYAALVLLVLGVLAAGLLAASGGGIAEAVTAQMARALCLVRGGECGEHAREPCVTASTLRQTAVGARLAVVRLSGGGAALRERRSDGSVVVRLVARGGLGLEIDAGMEIGLGALRLGGSVGGLVEGRVGRGRTWYLESDAEADRLLRALRARALRSMPRAGGIALLRMGDAGPPPEPDETFGEQGLGSELRARLGGAGIALEATDLIGSLTRRDGRRTLTLRRVNELSLGVPAVAGAVAGHEERYGLEVDGAGRPLALTIVDTLRIDGGSRLPAPLRAALGDQARHMRAGRLAVLERHLDLGDPASLAVAGAFIRALREPRLGLGERVAISEALRRRLDTAGSARALVYELDAERTELHGKAALGLGVGGDYERSTQTLRLVAARAMTPGGVWSERADCLRAA
jgi:hypothetical protein